MAEVKATPRDLLKTIEFSTSEINKLIFHTFGGHVLEVEDEHFNHNSAVLLPDRAREEGADQSGDTKATGLAVLAAAYAHVKKKSNQKMLILGHTDTTGAADYNVVLSQMRADSVLAALTGDQAGWVKIALKQHKVEDYQLILKWANEAEGYGCDPGPITNTHNEATKAALIEFKKKYNEDFSKSIKEDDSVKKETWEAFFDVYMDVLMAIMDTDDAGLLNAQHSITFVDDKRKSVGCGENFPVEHKGEDKVADVKNRRVEILFFDPGEEPKLDCHPARDKCLKKKCEIYDNILFDFDRIDPKPLSLPLHRLRFQLGEIDKVFPKIVLKNSTDPGVRARLQAVGFLHQPLVQSEKTLKPFVQDAWDHFKTVVGKKDDEAAVGELQSMVKNVIVDQAKIPAPGEFGKIRFPGTYCVRSASHFDDETSVWLGNKSLGIVPIMVQVEIFRRRKWKNAGNEINVHFQLAKPDDIPDGSAVQPPKLRSTPITGAVKTVPQPPPPKTFTFNMTGSPDKYVKTEKARNPIKPPNDPQVDNAHQSVGGKRGNAVVGTDRDKNLLEITNAHPGINDELFLAEGGVSSHPDSVVVATNLDGLACLFFMPSWMGGDRYKIKAFLDPVRGRPSDGTEDFAVAQETGTFVVFRIMRVSKYLRWDYPAPSTNSQKVNCGSDLRDFDIAGTFVKEFGKAFLDVIVEPGSDKPRLITQAEWQQAIRLAKSKAKPTGLKQPYNVQVLLPEVDPAGTPGINNPSPGIVNFLTAAQYNAAAKGPPPAGLPAWPPAPDPDGASKVADAAAKKAAEKAAADYWSDMAQIRFAIQTEIIKFFSHNSISGVTIIQPPAMSNFEADVIVPYGTPGFHNSGWGGSVDRGCYVVFGKNVYDNPAFPYKETFNAMHEVGHVFYRPHQYTDPAQVNVSTGNNYDEHDYHDLCIMGYMPKASDFCGRCLFTFAGYKVAAMPANNPGP